ncbi:MAG TPA: hypothetical protein VIM06_01545, partial [Rhodanobacter sp.]
MVGRDNFTQDRRIGTDDFPSGEPVMGRNKKSGTRHALAATLVSMAIATSALAAAPANPVRAAQLQDLDVVRSQYLRKEMAYMPASRALAEAQLERMERQAGTLSPA